jgi:hypothetical protein
MLGRTWIGLAILSLLPAGVRAEDPAIQLALNRGITFLKERQGMDGTWEYTYIGATALAALCLLECDVPANDPAIQKAATALREASIYLYHTYSISLAILFFDRLGEERDVALIESLAVRLMAGQTLDGGWTYTCPVDLGAEEVRRLKSVPSKTEAAPKVSRDKRERRQLPADIRNKIEALGRQRLVAGIGALPSDNSNTQFATLALWIARRHDIPVDDTMAGVEARFRNSQHPDGSWSYQLQQRTGTPAMTCAGLLALAAAHGLQDAVLRTERAKGSKQAPTNKSKPARDPGKDPAVRKGLVALGSSIGRTPARKRGGPGGGSNGWDCYTLWSIERVAMIFGLNKIGNKDWYAWGAQHLLASQSPDGSWQDRWSQGGASTCFALLFLRRANLAQDLTASLRGKVKDPSEVKLVSGGIGSPVAKAGPAELGNLQLENTEKLPSSQTAPHKVPVSPPPAQPVPSARPAEPEAELSASQLSKQLIGASPAKQEALLTRLRESKGVVHTEALGSAIPKLTGTTKTKARDALAERLSRMSAATLRDKLGDENPEVRRAAALACALKEDQQHVNDLIRLINDPEPAVSRAARAALKALAGEQAQEKPGKKRP